LFMAGCGCCVMNDACGMLRCVRCMLYAVLCMLHCAVYVWYMVHVV